MAPIYIVSALFMLALGSTPCLSIKCTKNSISNCYVYGSPGCIYRHKQMECLEKIDNSTCSDELLERYTEIFAQAREAAEACPGLPDGVCYFNALVSCSYNIPYEILSSKHLTEDTIKKLCKRIQGKEDEKRTCFKYLKPKCKADFILTAIDQQIKDVDDIQKKCASYE